MYLYPGAVALAQETGIENAWVVPRTPSPAAAFIGERIAFHRLRRGLTQDELAVSSRIDSSNIRSYESGRALMNVFSLVRIAEALDVEPGDLLDGLGSDMFVPAASDGRRGRATSSG